jgi:hypothetical protein
MFGEFHHGSNMPTIGASQMPTQPVTIRNTPTGLKCLHADGTEIAGVKSIAINAAADNTLTATITTTQSSIDALTVQADVRDGSLCALCDALASALSHIATQCECKVKVRDQKHVHGPAMLLANHIAKQIGNLRKTLEQAKDASHPATGSGTGLRHEGD